MKNIFAELASLLENKIIAGTGICSLAFLIFSSHTGRNGLAEAPVSERTIQVTGSSEMTIAPDDIEFIVGIDEYYESSIYSKKSGDHKAIAKLSKVEDEVRSKLISLGVKKEEIKTELFVSSYWYWYYNRHSTMTKQLKFKVDDYAIINKFVEELNIKGLSYMRMGNLSHKKILEFRKQVKKDALKAAQDKAAYLLESIGKKPGEVIEITEMQEQSEPQNWWSYYPQYSNSGSNMLSNSSSYSGGGSANYTENSEIRPIRIRYEVKASYEIRN